MNPPYQYVHLLEQLYYNMNLTSFWRLFKILVKEMKVHLTMFLSHNLLSHKTGIDMYMKLVSN